MSVRRPSSAREERNAASSGVPSPCTSVCTMDAASGYCRGCFRTLEEIAAWSVLDDAGKRRVMAALPARRAACAKRTG